MASDDEEDDYMSMAIPDTTASIPSTSLQKTALKRKAAEQRAHQKTKAEREAEAKRAQEAALSTSTLDPSNRGAKLMAKLGFKGGALGRSEGARTEPIELAVKGDRGGIGMDSEKKKRIREDMEQRLGAEKRQKADEGEYRERVRKEREEKRIDGMVWGAMKVVERLDTEAEEDGLAGGAKRAKTTEAKNVNVLWRALAKDRIDKEKDRRIRQGNKDYLSRSLPTVSDREEDADDRIALGTEVEELEEEDPELEEFSALDPSLKLEKLVHYLRTTYNYCFWCKFRYPDDTLEGCPGVTEEDHD